jgi:hypothetical protein
LGDREGLVIFRPQLVEKILAGEKTETRRKVGPDGKRRYRPGRTYAVQPGRTEMGVARIRVLSAEPEALKEVTEEGARREGFGNRAEFLDYWRGLYGAADPEQAVWVVRFELVVGSVA